MRDRNDDAGADRPGERVADRLRLHDTDDAGADRPGERVADRLRLHDTDDAGADGSLEGYAARPREQVGDDELPGIARQVGNTPLIRLTSIAGQLPESVAVYAKAEHLNPSGSVKDRAARNMMLNGLRSGALSQERILIDATSGNTGIAYAMIGAALGIRVCLAMPANASAERIQILRALGVELVLTDAMEGTDGSQRYVKERVAEAPDRYFYPDQYNNEANWWAHFDGTGPEIIRQTQGRLTAFVAGLGTSGTFVGTSRRLKQFDPSISCYAVQPDSPLHGMEGLKHYETAIVPGIFDPDLADHTLRIRTEDAVEMTRRLAHEEGLLVGVSSGANVAAALRVAREIEEGVVVTVLCDTGTRYLSESFWHEG